jgi:hypothetical protein
MIESKKVGERGSATVNKKATASYVSTDSTE